MRQTKEKLEEQGWSYEKQHKSSINMVWRVSQQEKVLILDRKIDMSKWRENKASEAH